MERVRQPDRSAAESVEIRGNDLVQAYLDNQDNLRRFIASRYGDGPADDLMQDLFLKVAGLESIGVIRSPAAYLYRLALNLSHDAYRRKRRAAARDESWRSLNQQRLGKEQIADLPAMEDVLAARRRLERLADAINELPTKTQRVFHLHKFDGLTQAQTAKALGMSQRMVEKRMRAALTTLLTKVGQW